MFRGKTCGFSHFQNDFLLITNPATFTNSNLEKQIARFKYLGYLKDIMKYWGDIKGEKKGKQKQCDDAHLRRSRTSGWSCHRPEEGGRKAGPISQGGQSVAAGYR